MGSLEETLERVQYKFASIIGELCGEPLALSQFAIWVDLRMAEYKLRGSISLDCTGHKIDPEWLNSLKTLHSDDQLPNNANNPLLKSETPVPPLVNNHGYRNSNGRNGAAFSSQLPSFQKQPPFAHSRVSSYPCQGSLSNTTSTTLFPRCFPQEPNSTSPNSSDVILLKTERLDDEGYSVASSSQNSSGLENKKRPLSIGLTNHRHPAHSSSKQIRVNDSPPPLKPISEDSMYQNSNHQHLSAPNKLGSILRESSQDSLENDLDYLVSPESSDVPEDLSLSNCNSTSWISKTLIHSDQPLSVLRPMGDYSCLSNGPRFSEQWKQFVTNRSINLKSMSSERYRGYMNLLKVAQSKVHVPKSVKEHKMLYKFDLWRDDSAERLIKKRHKDTDPVRFYISDDQLFHALLAVHLDSGHGGIKKMLTLCKERYANITADAVKLFTHLCYDCQTRKRTAAPPCKMKENPETTATQFETAVVNSSTSPTTSVPPTGLPS